MPSNELVCSYCYAFYMIFLIFASIVQPNIQHSVAHAWKKSIMKIGINCYASDGVYSVYFYQCIFHSTITIYEVEGRNLSIHLHTLHMWMTQSELPEI